MPISEAYKAELYSKSGEVIRYLLNGCEHQGVCDGCEWQGSMTGKCLVCKWTKAAADLIQALQEDVKGLTRTSEPCPECGEMLYSCCECRWRGTDSFEDIFGSITTYPYCNKFKKDTDHIRRRVFPGQRCPCWELPGNVNFCKTCGRPLKTTVRNGG